VQNSITVACLRIGVLLHAADNSEVPMITTCTSNDYHVHACVCVKTLHLSWIVSPALHTLSFFWQCSYQSVHAPTTSHGHVATSFLQDQTTTHGNAPTTSHGHVAAFLQDQTTTHGNAPTTSHGHVATSFLQDQTTTHGNAPATSHGHVATSFLQDQTTTHGHVATSFLQDQSTTHGNAPTAVCKIRHPPS